MVNTIFFGAVAGLIFGLLVMLLLGGGIPSLITPIILGILIGFLDAKINNLNIIIIGTLAGLTFFSITALLSNMLILDHAITGGLIGGIIGIMIRISPLENHSKYTKKIKNKYPQAQYQPKANNKRDHSFFRDKILAPLIVGFLLSIIMAGLNYFFTGEVNFQNTGGIALIGSLFTFSLQSP